MKQNVKKTKNGSVTLTFGHKLPQGTVMCVHEPQWLNIAVVQSSVM